MRLLDGDNPDKKLRGLDRRVGNLERRPPPKGLAGTYVFPPQQAADLFGVAPNRAGSAGPGFVTSGNWYHVWIDTGLTLKIPGGCYLNNYRDNAFQFSNTSTPTTPTSNYGDAIYFRFGLGPDGSSWGLDIGYMLGPDYGKLQFDLAYVADTSVTAPGVLKRYQDLTWFTSPFNPINAYQPAAGITPPRPDLLSQPFKLKLTGNAGDEPTAWNLGGINGGSGIYALRVYVTGKDASSSGYKGGLWSLSMNRIPNSGSTGGYLDPS